MKQNTIMLCARNCNLFFVIWVGSDKAYHQSINKFSGRIEYVFIAQWRDTIVLIYKPHVPERCG